MLKRIFLLGLIAASPAMADRFDPIREAVRNTGLSVDFGRCLNRGAEETELFARRAVVAAQLQAQLDAGRAVADLDAELDAELTRIDDQIGSSPREAAECHVMTVMAENLIDQGATDAEMVLSCMESAVRRGRIDQYLDDMRREEQRLRFLTEDTPETQMLIIAELPVFLESQAHTRAKAALNTASRDVLDGENDARAEAKKALELGCPG